MQRKTFQLRSASLAGVPLVSSSPREAALELCKLASSPKELEGFSFHLVNAYTIALASQNPDYAEMLRTSTANFPDGKPLTWWKLPDGNRLRQIRGPKLFEDVMDLGRASEVKHYLLGASNSTLELLEANLHKQFPGVSIVGKYSPPFRQMTESEVRHQDEQILASGAEIVWVGLGTPKQDWEVTRLAKHHPILSVAVGAAFDFTAGTKKAAPHWMASLSLEWLYRLLSEPRRLWRRYLVGNLLFLLFVLKNRSSTGRPS